MRRSMLRVGVAVASLAVPAVAVGAVKNQITIKAPKTVKVGNRYSIRMKATFDARLDDRPGTYIMMKALRHSGDLSCPKAVPLNRSGWTIVGDYTYIPKGDASDDKPVEFLRDSERITRPGSVTYCGYIVLAKFREAGAVPTYDTRSRTRAETRARR